MYNVYAYKQGLLQEFKTGRIDHPNQIQGFVFKLYSSYFVNSQKFWGAQSHIIPPNERTLRLHECT